MTGKKIGVVIRKKNGKLTRFPILAGEPQKVIDHEPEADDATRK